MIKQPGANSALSGLKVVKILGAYGHYISGLKGFKHAQLYKPGEPGYKATSNKLHISLDLHLHLQVGCFNWSCPTKIGI